MDGKWRKCATRSAEPWRARAYLRHHGGEPDGLSVVRPTKAKATEAIQSALETKLNSAGVVPMTAAMPLVKAGQLWLEGIRRTDSGKSARTVQDYTRSFARFMKEPGESCERR